MELKWPTWEEFVAGNNETRALSDARGDAVVEDDAWQTNVMIRVASGEQFELEPMTVGENPVEFNDRSDPFENNLSREQFDLWVKERYRSRSKHT